MSFANPYILFLLLLVPILVVFAIVNASQNDLHITVSPSVSSKTQKPFSNFLDQIGFHMPFVLRILSLVVLIIALARPQFGQSFSTSKNMGVDITVAIDTSQSMSALDLKLAGRPANRLEVVKDILKDFILKRSNDRLGLLVFGEKAYTQCPLTTDHGAILDLLKYVEIGMVGDSTAIGSAIAIAVKRMKDLKAKSRVLILLTDGQNTSGNISPLTAAELAKEFGIKIYTIGVGEEGEVPFQVQTPQGLRTIRQATRMDEDTLIEIAELTGGQYFRAKNTLMLKRVYEHINKLEKSEIEVNKYTSYKDYFEPFLWLAFLFFVLEALLGNTLFFRIN